MDLEWATMRVRIPIGLRTAEQVAGAMQTLDSAWQANAEAARYLLEKKDFEAGLKYANQSLALRETWYGFWLKASLLAARGDYPNARAAAERSIQLGHAAGSEFTPVESTVKQALVIWSAPGAPAPAPPAPKEAASGHAACIARARPGSRRRRPSREARSWSAANQRSRTDARPL